MTKFNVFLTVLAYSVCTAQYFSQMQHNEEPEMTDNVAKKPSVDETKIGVHAAMQPLSGITRVEQSAAVNGLGHGAFVRNEKTQKARQAH